MARANESLDLVEWVTRRFIGFFSRDDSAEMSDSSWILLSANKKSDAHKKKCAAPERKMCAVSHQKSSEL
jgi:hypothetical protein